MVLSQDLVESNPWWVDPEKINVDIQIERWGNSVMKWVPKIKHAFDFSNDLVYSLRGPRQIGKTTVLKLLIKDFLENRTPPLNIMYYAFDVESNPKELVVLIRNYLDNTESQRNGERCYLFLDEISSIKNWQKGIKKLWDQKRLENCTVVATGSHTVDIKMSAERLPGRRGDTEDALDKTMHPMKFSEFVSAIDPGLDEKIRKNFSQASDMSLLENMLRNNSMHSCLESIQVYLQKLNLHLDDYMLTGGIPKAVNQYAVSKRIDEVTYTDHLNAILGDFNVLNKHENTFRQLAGNIIKLVGWTSSWHSLRENTDIGADNTVSQYVGTLEDMFVISVLYQYNLETKKALYQKAKKIHFQDPFYFHVVNSWISNRRSFETSHKFVTDTENQGHLVESIVANHLIQLAFLRSRKKQMFDYHNYVYYWKYHKDREVDLIYNDGEGVEIPIEVKFQKSPTKRDLDGIINFKKHTDTDAGALLLTKDTLGVERECIMIPVSMFLLLI